MLLRDERCLPGWSLQAFQPKGAPVKAVSGVARYRGFSGLRGGHARPSGTTCAVARFGRTVRIWPDNGIESCRSTPILSAEGTLLGMLALHYKSRQPRDESDAELLQAASRLAARALEQRGFTERLEFQARHDSLTALPNRSYFMELLEAALRTPAIVLEAWRCYS